MIALRPDPRFLQVRRLTEVSRALTYAASQNEVLDLTLRETAGLLRTERVALVAAEPTGVLAIRASPAIRGDVQRIFQQATAIDEEVVGRLRAILERGGGLRFLAVPLVIAGEVAGILAAAPAAAAEAIEDDEWLLSAISDQAAVTLEKLTLQRASEAAEKLRRQREEQFESLYTSPLIGLVFKDSTGEVLDANDAFLALSGYSRDDLRRPLRWDDLTVRRLSRRNGAGDRRGLRPVESELVRKEGEHVEVLVGTARLQEQDRDLIFVMDLSTQKRAEGSLRLLSETSKALLGASLDQEALFKSLAWLVVPRFADWCAVESVQDGATTGQHVAIEHLRSSSVERALEWRRRFPPDANSPIGILAVMRTGQSQLHQQIPETFLAEYACESEGASGLLNARPRSAILVPMVLRNEVVGVITFVRAGNRRRFGSEDLLMAEEIARRGASAVENARLYRRAQAAIGLREEFLSVAAHELKTPLTSLKLQVDALEKAFDRSDDEKTNWLVSAATRQTERLTRLVDDLLDVTRITTGRVTLNREACDLGAVIRNAVSGIEAQASLQGTTIDLQLPPEAVMGTWDRARIEQVIVNLAANALKYGAGKPIHISLETADGMARLTVKDAGIGISQQDIPRIFDRFERAVSARHYGGLGLGLFIAREIVAAHGGDIEVHSRPSEGAEFVVRLPIPAGASPPGR